MVSSPEDGPVALVPAELEWYSTLQELTEAHLALKEWQLMQVSSAIMQAAAVIIKVVAAVLCIHWSALGWLKLLQHMRPHVAGQCRARAVSEASRWP